MSMPVCNLVDVFIAIVYATDLHQSVQCDTILDDPGSNSILIVYLIQKWM